MTIFTWIIVAVGIGMAFFFLSLWWIMIQDYHYRVEEERRNSIFGRIKDGD